MKKFGIIGIIIVLGILLFVLSPKKQKAEERRNVPEHILSMTITSPSFKNNEMIPKQFTCDGNNANPELDIADVPQNAKSLALIMHDPDAPMTGGFTHWVVWNIGPKTTDIKQESVPPGASEGINSRNAGYTGPCPPSGTHRYFFKLYALDTMLALSASTTKDDLESAMQGHTLAEAELIGLYSRNH